MFIHKQFGAIRLAVRISVCECAASCDLESIAASRTNQTAVQR